MMYRFEIPAHFHFRVVVVELVVSTHLKNIKSSQIWIISPNMGKNKKTRSNHHLEKHQLDTKKKNGAANLPKKPVPQWLPWVCTASHRNNTPRRAGESSVEVRVSWRFAPSFDSASKWPTKQKKRNGGKKKRHTPPGLCWVHGRRFWFQNKTAHIIMSSTRHLLCKCCWLPAPSSRLRWIHQDEMWITKTRFWPIDFLWI